MNPLSICHLCLTQSPLITLVFQAAMDELEVPPDSVRSISRRSVKPAGQGVCLDDLSTRLDERYKKFDRRGYSQLLAELRGKVAEITGGRKFIAYIPHTQRLMYQEIIGLPECNGYRFVEEGFTSMAWRTHQGPRSSLRKRFVSRLRTWWTGSAFRSSRDMFDVTNQGFLGAVAISRHAFATMDRVTNVGARICRYEIGDGRKRLFVILDTSYIHRGIQWADYSDALVGAVLDEAADAQELMIKFHFADNECQSHFSELKEKISLEAGLPMRLLSGDFAVEEQLTASDLVIFSVSSLGYYAAGFGAQVRCFAPQVKGMDIDTWIRKGGLPADFPEVVKLNAKANGTSR